MEYGADLNARRQGGRSLLVSAIYNRDLATAHILLHAGASVEGDPSISALRASAEMSNTEMVKYMIAAGDWVGDDKKFDIWHRSDQNKSLSTPIQIASKVNNAELVQIFWSQSADPNLRIRESVFEEHAADVDRVFLPVGECEALTTLKAAVRHGNQRLVRMFLNAHANVKNQAFSEPALQIAAACDLKTVKFYSSTGLMSMHPLLIYTDQPEPFRRRQEQEALNS